MTTMLVNEIKSFPAFHAENDGCTLADDYLGYRSSCFECPFSDCDRGRIQRILRERRNAEVVELSNAGKSLEELASHFNVSVRTIQRILLKEKDYAKAW